MSLPFTTWALGHPYETTCAAYVVLSLINGSLPARAQTWPVVGLLVRVLDRLAFLVHRDSPGTLSWPLVSASVLPAVAPVTTGTP